MISESRRGALTSRLKVEALDLGFDAVGVTAVRPSDHAAFYRAWLEAGHHGELSYLAREDAVERRLHPERAWPELRSAIVVAMGYAPESDTTRPAAPRHSPPLLASPRWGEELHLRLRASRPSRPVCRRSWAIAARPDASARATKCGSSTRWAASITPPSVSQELRPIVSAGGSACTRSRTRTAAASSVMT